MAKGVMCCVSAFSSEFPGQTHIFLWRERQALAELGIDADLISTRPPPRAVASHSWDAEAAGVRPAICCLCAAKASAW